MIQHFSKKTVLLFTSAIFFIVSFLFISCQKELSGNGITLPVEVKPDLTTKIESTVAGFVTDESDAAVKDATVKVGSSSTTTDKYGYFEVKNVQVVKTAAVVTIIKPGYFNGIKTYEAKEGKGAFFRIKLLPKTTAGNIDATTGGTVTLSNGMKVTLPAAAVVNAATNAAYTGQVNIATQWLNPAAADLSRIMPGDLRGLDTEGSLKLLSTYGMCAVELTGSAGELLQVASGKKAALNFPIPSTLSSSAPATIPLWYFDESIGLWKEQGSATKSGNNYTGEVSHFSYWNCDIKLDQSVAFDLTVKDAAGNPIPSATVSFDYGNGTYTGAHGVTDANGYINGRVPANAQLVIKIYADYTCNGPAYTQNITTTTSSLSLGTVTIGSNNTATITGNVTDCSNAPVTNGYVIVQAGYYNYKAEVKPDGTFSLGMVICGGSNTSANIIAVDMAGQQQSTPLAKTIVSGDNAAGTLNACGTTIQEFINYNINGTDYSLSAPATSISQEGNSFAQYISAYSSGTQNRGVSISFTSTGIGVGSSQSLQLFTVGEIADSTQILTPITVNITEYGAVGQFIAGNFSGTLTGGAPANTPYVVTCSFRVKRRI